MIEKLGTSIIHERQQLNRDGRSNCWACGIQTFEKERITMHILVIANINFLILKTISTGYLSFVRESLQQRCSAVFSSIVGLTAHFRSKEGGHRCESNPKNIFAQLTSDE